MGRSIGRREFLEWTAAAGLCAAVPGCAGTWGGGAGGSRESGSAAEKLGWELCAQLYTFRRFPFYEALDSIAALGFRSVEPCFFLPLDGARPGLTTSEALPPEVRKELRAKLADRGIEMANFYADLGAEPEKNRRIFDFAKEMGVRTLVAEPPPEAFDGIEKLCDEYAIQVAVHNHPKAPGSRYWSPEAVLEVLKGRGPRVGACTDTGHWVRSGLDPVACLKKMEGRILTLHLKDVAEEGRPEARDVPLGTGKANYAAVLEELRRQGFRGVASIEYEHDSEKLAEEVRQCLEFVEAQAKRLVAA